MIEWPADKVDIIGGQYVSEHGFKKTITTQGFLLLEWDQISESATVAGRGISYMKIGYLRQVSEKPELWKYKETFMVKPDYSLWLHSPYERLNAIGKQFSAIFIAENKCKKNFYPRELSEWVSHEKSVLIVDWTLEVLANPRLVW